jgi:hypothetical protein
VNVRNAIILLAAALLVAACGREPAPVAGGNIVDAAPAPATPASHLDAGAPAADGTVHLRLTAPADRPLHLDNCNGAFSWGLEHRVGDAWRPAWIPPINGCASVRLVIGAGQSRTLVQRFAPGPGEALPAGTYRLAVYGLHYTPASRDAPDESVAPDRRASAPFAFDPNAR